MTKVYVLILSEEVGPVDSATYWFADRILGCYSSHKAAVMAGEDLGDTYWRIEERPVID